MTHQEIKELAGHRAVPPWVMKLVGDAIAIEREACAKLTESFQRDRIYTADLAGAIGAIKHKLADAIRARK